MKKKLFTLLLVATLILTVLIPTVALADTNASGVVTIDGTLIAGTLHSRVQALDGIDSPMDVTSLTITATGSLDPSDISYINAMINLTRLDVDTTITCTDAGDNFLTNFKNLTYVKFPAVTYGDLSFSDQTTFDTNLVEVNLPNATTFGEQAFYEREGLTTVSLPKAKTFGDGAFAACRGLTSISLPEAITFDTYAFTNCSSLASVSLPKAESFGFYAFNCSVLTSISLPEATTFGGCAFDGATQLTSVSTPKATSFGSNTFGMGQKNYATTWTLGSTPPTVISFYSGVPSAGSIVRIPESAVSTYDPDGDGKWLGWTINTIPVAVTGVEVLPATASVVMGDTTSLTANVLPVNAANKDVAWNSSNESVATVSSSGVVTGISVGNATITATTDDGGFTDDCVVTVQPIAATGVQVLPATASVVIEDTTNLTANVLPANASNKDVAWSSSNESVATVSSSGVVTGVSVGNATITATTDDGGFTDDCVVTVQPITVTGVEVLPATASIGIGGTKNLTATVSPSNATNKDVAWSSSNESVATVSSSGVVTGVSVGNAIITATTDDGGFTDSCVVAVQANTVAVTGVEVTPESATVDVGETKTLTAQVSPSSATNKDVIWSSSNDSIATVDSNGVVTAVSEGVVTITATSDDNSSISDSCQLTVEEPADQKGTVEGVLVDDEGNPLVGYTVVLNSNPITTVTNSEGKFKFTDVPLTVHRLDIKNSSGVELTQYNLDFSKGNTAAYTTSGQDIDITYTSTTASIVLGFEFDGDSTVTLDDLSFVENPQTGDDSTIILFIIIGALGLVTLLLAFRYRTRVSKQKKEQIIG